MSKKPRSIEATRLEGDYLARLHEALSHISKSEAIEIEENVTEHIRAAADDLDTDEISLTQMAAILEELGSPEGLIVEPETIEAPFPELYESPAAAPIQVDSSTGETEFLDRLFAGYLIAIVGLYIPLIDFYFCSIIGYVVILLALKKAPTPVIASGKIWALVSAIAAFAIFPVTLLSFASKFFALLGLPALFAWVVCDIVLFWIVFGGMADWIEKKGFSELGQKTRNLRLIYIVTTLLVFLLAIPIGIVAMKENDQTVSLAIGLATLPIGWVIGWFLVLRPIRRIRQAIG